MFVQIKLNSLKAVTLFFLFLNENYVKQRNEKATSYICALTKKKVIWSTSEKFNKAQRSQSKTSQPHYSIKRIDVISYLPNLCEPVIHLDQKTIWWTIPPTYWCWQLLHELEAAGSWAGGTETTMCYQCILWSTFAAGRKSIHVKVARVHTHAHTHTYTALFHTFRAMHIYTHKCVRVCVCAQTHTETVSIPLLYFVLVVVYYRSRLCNCVGVVYFLHTRSLFSFLLCICLSSPLCSWNNEQLIQAEIEKRNWKIFPPIR